MNKPLVWAHRGASGYAPENTLAAFKKAVEMKADGVELDVQLTKDGEIVVCHDETIDRTSDKKGLLMDYSLEELKKFDFSNSNPAFEGEQIPPMSEVFDLLKDTDLTINIELKMLAETFSKNLKLSSNSFPTKSNKLISLVNSIYLFKNNPSLIIL